MQAESLFLSRMRDSGFEPDCHIVADGKLHRFRDWLDRPGTRNGWYVLFGDFPEAGAFGCWKRGIRDTWCILSETETSMSSGRIAEISRIVCQHDARHRSKAQILWESARPANGRHGYLIRKRVQAHGLRYASGALLVPVMDTTGAIHGLQRIYRDGAKRFTYGTNKLGHFFVIHGTNQEILCLAEGYATAATIFEVTGCTAVVSFDASNLLPVARVLRSAYPDSKIIICADNDRHLEDNIGVRAATDAATAANGTLLVPNFCDPHSTGTDINDLLVEEGPAAITALFAKGGL